MKPNRTITRRALLLGGTAVVATAAVAPRAKGQPKTVPTTAGNSELAWPERRKRIERAWLDLLGEFPGEISPLRAEMKKVAHEKGITRYHVSFQAEPDDRVTAWLLVPDAAHARPTPAMICIHSTTFGSGKDSTVGLAGRRKGDPPHDRELGAAYGLDLARHGFVTLSLDLINDGERIKGERKGDSRWFYRKHPEWSIVGKNTWDVMRSVDFLRTLDFVAPDRIGCTGWSLGGHSALFAAAFDPRLAATISNGGVLDWHRPAVHWSRLHDHKTSPDLARRFGFSMEIGPNILIKKFRPYVDDPQRPVPTDFDELMMMVAPRPLLIISSEWEFYSHKLMPKCLAAAKVYAEWRDADGLPSVVEARKARLGYDRTLAYYGFHNRISEERIPDMLSQIGAGDCFSWFSFTGGHSYPPVARRHTFAWLDRWLGHVPHDHDIA